MDEEELLKPLTSEDVYNLFNDPELGKKGTPSTLKEAATSGKSTSQSRVEAANEVSEGNHSSDMYRNFLNKKTAEDKRIEAAAQEAIHKIQQYQPKDYSEVVAKEVLDDAGYKELKDLKAEKQRILDEDPSYKEAIKKSKEVTKDMPWWANMNGAGPYAPKFMDDAVKGLAEWALPETYGMSETNAKKIKEVNERLYQKSLPVMNNIKDKVRDARFRTLMLQEAFTNGIEAVGDLSQLDPKTVDMLRRVDGLGKEGGASREQGYLNAALDKADAALEYIDAAIERKGMGDAFLDNLDKDLYTIGLASTVNDLMYVLPAVRAAENDQQELDPFQQILLEATAIDEYTKGSDIQHGYGYRIMDGSMKNVPFLAQMALTGGVAGTVKKGAGSVIKGAVKKGVNKGIAKYIGGSLGNIAAVGLQTMAMPMTYQNIVNRYKGQLEPEFDDQGNITRILFDDTLYKEYVNESKILSERDRKRREEILEGTPEKFENELNILEARLGLGKMEGVESYEDMLQKVAPKSTRSMGKAIRQGFFDTANELVSERFGGKLFDNYVSKIPLFKKLPLRTSNTKAGKFYKAIKEGTSTFSNHIGLNSIPGEMFEEYFVAPLNALNDGSWDEIKALGEADTHLDILGQTALMGIGFRGVGGAVNLPSRLKNPEFYKNRKEIRKQFAKMRNAVDDAELAETMDFNTSQSGFTVGQYQFKIQDLRNKGKDQEANELEQKMFYNMAVQSFKTNTADELIDSLDKVSKNPNISNETKMNVQSAKKDIDQLNTVFQKYRHLPNIGTIVQLESNKIIGRRSNEKLKEEITEARRVANEEIEAFKATNNIDVPHNMYNLWDAKHEDQETATKYNDFLEKLENANIAAVETLNILETGRDEIQKTIYDSMREMNKQVSNSHQETLKAQASLQQDFMKAVKDAAIDVQLTNESLIASSDGSTQVDIKQFDLTEDFVEEQFNKLAAKYGKRLNKEAIDEIKNPILARLKITDMMGKLADTETINRNVDEQVQQENAPLAVEVKDEPLTEDEQAIRDTVEEEMQKISDNATVVKIEDMFDDFDDLPASTDKMTDAQKEVFKTSVGNIYGVIEKTTGKKPTFEDMMEHMFKYGPKEMVEEHYNAYKLGWQQNGYAKTDFDSVYNKLFDPAKEITENAMGAIANIFGTTADEDRNSVEEKVEKQEKSVEAKTVPISKFTQENLPIKTVAGRRIATPETKLGFNAIKYSEVIDGDGQFHREPANEGGLNLDEQGIVDFRPLLNPDSYNAGSDIRVEVAPEDIWDRITVSTGRDNSGTITTTTFDKWVAEREVNDQNFRDSKEFRDKVPMFAISHDGTPMSYIHDTDWYNPFNVADPSSDDGIVDLNNISVAQAELIQAGKDNVSDMREKIYNGEVSTIKINGKKEGAFYKIPKGKPEISVMEANPQAVIAVQKGSTLMVSPTETFNNSERILVNEPSDFETPSPNGGYRTDGDTWDIRRIGVDPETGRQTWRAFPVTRRNDKGTNGIKDSAFETLKWLFAAQARINDRASYIKNTPYDISMEKAEEIRAAVQRYTGVDITAQGQTLDFFKAIGLPNVNKRMDELQLTDYGQNLYTQSAEAFKQSTRLNMLGNNRLKMINIDAQGNVENLDMPYEDYVKTVVSTNIKSFNVGTEANPVYATSLQPVITYGSTEQEIAVRDFDTRATDAVSEILADEDVTNPKDVAQETERLLKDLGFKFEDEFDALPTDINDIANLNNIFDVIEGLDLGQEHQIVDYIFHNLLVSVDQKYKGSVNKDQLLNELKNSYKSVIGVSKNKLSANLVVIKQSHPELAGRVEKALGVYNNIEKGWSNIEKKALDEINKYTSIEITKNTELSDEEDLSLREKDYSKESFEQSTKQSVTYKLRRFMSGIREYTPEGELKTGFLGLPTYMSFDDVFNSISQYFGTGIDMEADYEVMSAKLKEMAETQPWVKEFIDKLDNSDEQTKKGFVHTYAKHAIQMKFAMYSTGQNGTTLKLYDTNANEITRIVRKRWENNLMATDLINRDGISINKAKAQVLLNDYASWDQNKANVSESKVRDWLGAFGIELSNEAWGEIKDGKFFYDNKYMSYNDMFHTKAGLFSLLNKYLQKITTTEDTSFDENEKNHPYKDMQGVLKNLAKIQARYEPQAMVTSFRDNGKQISGQIPPTYLTDRVAELRRSALGNKETLEQLATLSMSQNSIILDLLLNEPDFANKFQVVHNGITALKQLGRSASAFSSITDLNTIDHDIAKLTGYQDTQQGQLKRRYKDFTMRMGSMFLPTMSDKSRMLMLQTGVFDLMEQSSSAFKKDANDELVFTDQLRELMYDQLVLPEIKRMLRFHQQVQATDITGYDLGAQMFNFLPSLNNVKDSNGIRLIKYIAESDNIDLEFIESNFKSTLMDAVEEVVHTKAQEKMDLWNDTFVERNEDGTILNIKFFDSKYLSRGKGTLNEKFEVGTYDFIINSMIANANSFTLIAGDPAIYSQDKLFRDLPVDNNKIRSIAAKYGKSNVFGMFDSFKKFSSALDDAQYKGLISDNLYDEMKINIRPLVYDAKDDNFYANTAKKIGVNIGKRLALLIAPGTKLANSKNNRYKQLFLADPVDISENSEYLIKLFYGKEAANGAVPLLNSYRDAASRGDKRAMEGVRSSLMDMFPRIANYFEIESADAQEYSTVKEHLDILWNQSRLTDEQRKTIMDKVNNDQQLTKEELNIVMQPIKPVYNGQVFDPEQDVARTVYVKSSSFPLLPQLTAGTKLDNLRKKMEEYEAKTGMTVRASYQTANKVGSMKNALNPLEDFSMEDMDNSSLILDRNNFRIQQDVPFKSDKKKEDTVSMGTQIFKLLFGDGMMDIDGFEYNGETMDGRKLQSKYNEVFKKFIDSKRAQLYNELGLDDNGTPKNAKKTVAKLQDLLRSEAIDRGYPIQDIKGLELEERTSADGNTYYEFKVPLWLSANSNRFESMLNSIITNRIMKHKLPGNSFVVGSENGFAAQEGLEGVDKSRIIYLDGWNGVELQGTKTVDGKLQKAQIMVPSKIKTQDGKLLDLFQKEGNGYKYLTRKENGSLTLKDGMIDPEVLTNFTFRTPTSFHASASSVEIVGIIPPESGDLMLVPKNFTTQKGLDYDVDKENAYQLHHVVEQDGTVTVLNESHKDRMVSPLLAKLATEVPTDNMMRAIFGDEFDNAIEQLQDMTTEERIAKVSAKFDQKLMENEFIRIHQAVFNNPSDKVQQKINKVLSMDFAASQADMIEGLTEEAKKNEVAQKLQAEGASQLNADNLAKGTNEHFTILSDQYQKEKMGLGASGKMAIGVYSNYVTFHSLTQQQDNPIRMMVPVEEVGLVPKAVRIGNLVSDGSLGGQNTLKPENVSEDVWSKKSRTIAEAFAEKQNTATDNEKEQILGRVNINNMTIGVDSLLTALGFDQDENGNSVPYLLLSQPIIKEYVEKLEASRGISSDFKANVELEILDEMVSRYSNGTFTAKEDGVYNKESGERLGNGHVLNGDALVNGIKFNGSNKDVQLAALDTFLELRIFAKSLANIQSVVNTNDLGKSMVESNMLVTALEEFTEFRGFGNVDSLIGKFEDAQADMPKPRGAYLVGDKWITPTTAQGQIVVNGIMMGDKMWKEFFPYSDQYFNEVVEDIMDAMGANIDTKFQEINARHEIIREAKKYIYSRRKNGIFDQNANTERKRLFMDQGGLATYLNELSNDKDSILKTNKLLNRFTYTINKAGKPSLIEFNNTDGDNFDEVHLYNAFAELIINDRKLPDWNGEPYSTKQLAQDLIVYAYVEGGVQEAIQFVKYVPVEYLESVGVETPQGFVAANEMLQSYNPARRPDVFKHLLGYKEINDMTAHNHTFTKQFFQHNPDRARSMSNEDQMKNMANKQMVNGKLESFTYMGEAVPRFATTRNKTKSREKQDVYNLYEHVGNGKFMRISVLGTFGMNEYQYNNDNAVSLIEDIKPEPVSYQPNRVTPSKKDITNSFNIKNGESLTDVMQRVADMKYDRYKHINEAAKILLPLLKDTTDVRIETGSNVNGRYNRKTDTVHMDANVLSRGRDQIGRTLFHEAVHSVTSNELRKYYDKTGLNLLENAPAHVINLHLVFSEFRKQIDQSAIDNLQRKIANRKAGLPDTETLTDNDLALTYGATSIFEFVTTALTEPTFQIEMSKVPYKSTGQSIWERFKEAVLRILKTLSPELQQDTLAANAIMETLNFITEEQKIRKPLFQGPKVTRIEDESLFEDQNELPLAQGEDRLPEIKNCK